MGKKKRASLAAIGGIIAFLAVALGSSQAKPRNGNGPPPPPPPGTGDLSVRVVDHDSRAPILNATVNANGLRAALAGPSGVYLFNNIPPKTYTVTAQAGGYKTATTPATVTAGQTKSVTMALTRTVTEPPPPPVLKGAILDAWVEVDGIRVSNIPATGGRQIGAGIQYSLSQRNKIQFVAQAIRERDLTIANVAGIDGEFPATSRATIRFPLAILTISEGHIVEGYNLNASMINREAEGLGQVLSTKKVRFSLVR